MAPRAGLDRITVVQAAADLADQQGLEAVSLAQLAAQLGVRPPTIYHYVDGLAGLRRELALLGTHELAQRLGHAVMGQAGDAAVLALAHAYRAFVEEHPGLYAATVRAADPTDSVLVTVQSELVEVAMRTLTAYHLTGEDAVHAVRMLRTIAHGFATLERDSGFGSSLDLNESFRRLLQMFIVGLHQPKLASARE